MNEGIQQDKNQIAAMADGGNNQVKQLEINKPVEDGFDSFNNESVMDKLYSEHVEYIQNMMTKIKNHLQANRK